MRGRTHLGRGRGHRSKISWGLQHEGKVCTVNMFKVTFEKAEKTLPLHFPARVQ